jgi:hypothetical protein
VATETEYIRNVKSQKIGDLRVEKKYSSDYCDNLKILIPLRRFCALTEV